MPQTVAIFDVVVDERVIVQQFNGRAGGKRRGILCAERARRGEHEPWPQTLSGARTLRVAEAEVMTKLRPERLARLGDFNDIAKILLE